MDGRRFDELSKTLALDVPRRGLLGKLGLGAIAAAMLGRPARASAAAGDECVMNFAAMVGTGDSKNDLFAGELAFVVDEDGAIDDGLFTTEDGDEFDVVGSAIGREIRLQIDLGDDRGLFLSGIAERDVLLCRGRIMGTFAGPELNDAGSWLAQKSKINTDDRGSGSRSNGGSSGPGGGSSDSGSSSGGNTNSGNSNGGNGGDNGSSGGCPDGQRVCDGACVDVLTSNDHCGACGNFCASGTICQNAMCVDEGCGTDPNSGRPLEVCNGICTDLSGDYDNCGACGNACLDSFVCIDGSCICPFQTGNPLQSVDCGGYCAFLDQDVKNCGACGVVCEGYNRRCVNGQCACLESSCIDPSRTQCPSAEYNFDPCVLACVDLLTDPMHCGSCTNVCFSGRCENGFCANISLPGL